MQIRGQSILAICLLVIALPAVAEQPQPDSTRRQAGLELFEKKIRPALIQHCYECHSGDAEDVGGELLLDTRQGLLAGGETGPAVEPGKPRDSLIIRALEFRDLEMPPDEKLPDDVIADFRRWVALGAPDPRKGSAKSSPAQPVTEPVDLWSLHPIARPTVPPVNNVHWPTVDADRFILARLEQEQIEPNPDAEPATLIRRVYFDLIGLPPPPQEVAAFVADPSDRQFAAVVDRLLSSAQFGERWGRHWLDVARYGESAGSSRDVLMLYAWRYRDYVIDAFNSDMPFDQFITEQVAGDLLPQQTEAEAERLLIATGLLAIGSKSLNGGNLTYDVIDDQIDVISKAVLGLTVSCARCHDHKFDPIPTADYYSLAGIFLSTDTRYGGSIKRPKSAKEKSDVYLSLGPQLDPETAKAMEAAQKKYDQLVKQVASSQKRVATLTKQVPKKFLNGKDTAIPSELDAKTAKLIQQYRAAVRILGQRREALQAAEADLGEEPKYALGVRDAKTITDAKILVRGDKGNLGDPAPRGFLTAVDRQVESPSASVAPIDQSESGRRQLAAWLVHPDNPLTPRVAVNRIWQHLMGSGLVATVDNFGVNGEMPSHPELLDHLAHRFVSEHRWSTKAMIRELILSRTYRQSSSHNEAGYLADPDNRLRWRMPRRRLEAEPLRDAMLAISGLLKSEPLSGSLVMQIGEGEVGRNINTSVLEQPFDHRSVYLPIIRGIIPEELKLFDFPEPSNVQGRRDSNTTPTQSLFLMNSEFAIRCAKQFASQLLDDPTLTSDEERVAEAHLRCFGQPPTAAQVSRAIDYLGMMSAEQADRKKVTTDLRQLAWTSYCQTLFASAPFRFIQ